MAHHHHKPAPPVGTESPAGTTVTTVGPTINASPTPGTAGSGNLIAITSGGAISVNGTTVGGSSVIELYYTNHTCDQENSSGAWFGPITASSTGSAVADPRPPVLSSITLSSSSFTGGVASGTVVGAITVVMAAGLFTGTLSLSGTNASSFQISGTNLETNGVVANGSYSINIIATQSGAGGSPLTKPFTITGSSSAAWPNNAPAQAVNAGFTNLVFFDDFTSDNISQSQSGFTTGKLWYAARFSQTSPTNYQILASDVATNAANNSLFIGATQIPARASPNGGIWQILGISSITNNGNFQTIPQSEVGTSYTGLPGTWKHYYIEALIQYNASGSSSQGSPAGPSFWTLSPNYTTGTEFDCMEIFGGSCFEGTGHTPGGGADDSGTPIRQGSQYRTSEWQVIGYLWVSTGAGTGLISYYVNDVLIGTHATGTGSSTSNMENDFMFILAGTGLGFPVYYDWVKLWQ